MSDEPPTRGLPYGADTLVIPFTFVRPAPRPQFVMSRLRRPQPMGAAWLASSAATEPAPAAQRQRAEDEEYARKAAAGASGTARGSGVVELDDARHEAERAKLGAVSVGPSFGPAGGRETVEELWSWLDRLPASAPGWEWQDHQAPEPAPAPNTFEIVAGQSLRVAASGPQWVTAPTGNPLIDTTGLRLGQVLRDVVDVLEAEPLIMKQPLYGIYVHKAFADLLRKGQVPDIEAKDVETTFSVGELRDYGFAGAIRTDVVLRGPDRKVIAIFDVKTGSARLSASRAAELRDGVGVDSSVPVIVLKVGGIERQ